MTLGDKIRENRRKCGISQEQLADKMAVSRSAIAKWETDKGLPDVGNLKMLARLLNVSVDYLLDEGQAADHSVIREHYNLAAYGYGCSKIKKDRVIREKYPDATIYLLLGQQESMTMEPHPANTSDCRTSQTDNVFYLVEKENRQFLVTVSDAFIETRPLDRPLQGNSFRIDGWNFIKCNYEVGS